MSVSEKIQGNKNAEKWDIERTEMLLEFILFKIEVHKIEFSNELDSFFGFKEGSIRYILSKHNLYKIVTKKINEIEKTRTSFIKRRKATVSEKKKQNAYVKNKYKTNPNYRLRHSFSSLLRHHLKTNKNKKHTFNILNYSLEDLKNHLEKKFNKKMNWDNYGKYWHVDHIIPASHFNQLNELEFIKCWSLENLQPLEAVINISKGNRYVST